MSVFEPISPHGISEPHSECFKAAAEFIQQPHVLDGPDKYRLAHGNMATLQQDKAVNHAWIEEGDFVYEVRKGHNLLFSKYDYYKRNRITNVRTYTVQEVLELIHEHGHYGPWN